MPLVFPEGGSAGVATAGAGGRVSVGPSDGGHQCTDYWSEAGRRAAESPLRGRKEEETWGGGEGTGRGGERHVGERSQCHRHGGTATGQG